jgi:hypothetical protein
MSDWLIRFISNNQSTANLRDYAYTLASTLNQEIAASVRQGFISGFHLAGHNSLGLPEFWFIRNVKDDMRTLTGTYKAREDFLRRDARGLGYNGVDLLSARTGSVQTYRNGDIRAHVKAWETIDVGFSSLLGERDFKQLRNVNDYGEWVKFKMEVIAYSYKKYCRVSLVARPIDTLILERHV